MYVCTAGEDTSIRLQELCVEPDRADFLATSQLVLRGHVCSVKCLATLDEEDGSVLLVSGGGRAQLRIWRLQERAGDLVCINLADFMLCGHDKNVRRPWRKAQSAVKHNPVTRFLSLAVQRTATDLTKIFVGCSDSLLRVFEYAAGEIVLQKEVDFQEHCILRLKLFPFANAWHLLASTTGGRVFVWKPDEKDWSQNFEQFTIHQSGINCVDSREVGHSVELLSGGDDNALVLSRLEYEEGGQLAHRVVWREDSAHAAQITGVVLLGNYVDFFCAQFEESRNSTQVIHWTYSF